MLRFGVRYPDGPPVLNMLERDQHPLRVGFDETLPRLKPMSGHGSAHRQDEDLFLTPLPPDGLVELFCAWPAYGIEESRAIIDLTGVAQAAGGTVELWPFEPDHHRSGPPELRLGDPGDAFFRPILDDEDD